MREGDNQSAAVGCTDYEKQQIPLASLKYRSLKLTLRTILERLHVSDTDSFPSRGF